MLLYYVYWPRNRVPNTLRRVVILFFQLCTFFCGFSLCLYFHFGLYVAIRSCPQRFCISSCSISPSSRYLDKVYSNLAVYSQRRHLRSSWGGGAKAKRQARRETGVGGLVCTSVRKSLVKAWFIKLLMLFRFLANEKNKVNPIKFMWWVVSQLLGETLYVVSLYIDLAPPPTFPIQTVRKNCST